MLCATSVRIPSIINSAIPKVKVPKASANNPFFIILCVLSFKNYLFFGMQNYKKKMKSREERIGFFI